MKTSTWKKFGDCTAPCGKRGPWEIDEFDVLDDASTMMFNLRAVRDGNAFSVVYPGHYKRLAHKTRGVIMSNTPMEIRTNLEAYTAAKGRVLINGLGMGMLLEALIHKPAVEFIRVVEIDKNVINLVGSYFKAMSSKVEIVLADAMTYKPAKGEFFDYTWHDIWDGIGEENLPAMAILGRRYSKRVCAAQGFWGRAQARMYRQQNARLCG